MRYKITLEVISEVYGAVLPICYQHELSSAVKRLLTANMNDYSKWLTSNGFTPEDCEHCSVYSISNLYIPKIYVQADRLQIRVPRVQFWLSVFPEYGTTDFIKSAFLNNSIVLGDKISRVLFKFSSVDVVSPVDYVESMSYQTLSPVVVRGVRPNKSIEYLFPQNPYFAEFIVQELIHKWEFLHRRTYEGTRQFQFQLLFPERRKAVSVDNGTIAAHKVIGYMMKFRLIMDPMLQEVAYVCGIGDDVHQGFGYIELIDKT